jgi:hypothetical protein
VSGSKVVLVAAPDGDAAWGLSVRGTVRVLGEMAAQAPLVIASTEPDALAGLGTDIVALPDTPARRGLFRRKADPTLADAAARLVDDAAVVVLAGGWRRSEAAVVEAARAAGTVVGVFGRTYDGDDLNVPRDALPSIDRFGMRDPGAAARIGPVVPGKPAQALGDPLSILARDAIPAEDEPPEGVVVGLRDEEAIGPAAAAALRAAGAGRVTTQAVGDLVTGDLDLPLARLVLTSSPRLAFVALARGAAAVAIERRDAAAAMEGSFQLFDLPPRTWHPGSPQSALRSAAEQALADVDEERRLLNRDLAGGLVRHQRHFIHRLLEQGGLAHSGRTMGPPES